MEFESEQAVITPIGTVVVATDKDSGHVVVTIAKREGVSLRHTMGETDDGLLVELWEGRRLPRLHDEVTIDGSSIEVLGVTQDPDGTVWVLGDNGRRHRYE